MSVRHFQDCFTTVEWHAKCQVRSLSLYLPLQVREQIFRLCFAGNRVDNGGVFMDMYLPENCRAKCCRYEVGVPVTGAESTIR
jgi:hypothetical protein